MVKNRNWLEANQLAIYKRDRGFQLETAKNKYSKRSGWELQSTPFIADTVYVGASNSFPH